MAGWLVNWGGLDSIGDDPRKTAARFERKEGAIAFARKKAKELGRDVQLIDNKTPGDYPMWRAILGWYPKEAREGVWFKVSPDDRVERTESPEEFLPMALRVTRR